MERYFRITAAKIVIFLGTFVLLSGRLTARAGEDTSYYNVKAFGAVGNGIKNDLPALQKCFDAATVKGGIAVVEFPLGTYNIDQELKININNCKVLIIRGLSSNKQLPEISSKRFISILQVFSFNWIPKGTLYISNIAINGNNSPYSETHPYFDKPASSNGISVINLKQVYIRMNTVRNIYGNGILVSYSNISKDLNNRFEYVEISGNNVQNCWGLHPNKSPNGTFDDYGDGIYTSCIKKGKIFNNTVVNNLTQTKQFGRVGITLEYYNEDIEVTGNYIFGYDRNIHVEGDIGGHLIKNNRLEGSDFGILIYCAPSVKNKPIAILSNRISNRGLPVKNQLTRVRNSEERCLLSFYATEGCREGSKVSGNEFLIDATFDYKFSSIVRFSERGLIIDANKFTSRLPASVRKSISLYYSPRAMSNNTFDNIDLNFIGDAEPVNPMQNRVLRNVKSNKKIF